MKCCKDYHHDFGVIGHSILKKLYRKFPHAIRLAKSKEPNLKIKTKNHKTCFSCQISLWFHMPFIFPAWEFLDNISASGKKMILIFQEWELFHEVSRLNFKKYVGEAVIIVRFAIFTIRYFNQQDLLSKLTTFWETCLLWKLTIRWRTFLLWQLFFFKAIYFQRHSFNIFLLYSIIWSSVF